MVELAIDSLALAAPTSETASIALALDSRESMGTIAFTDPDTGERLSLHQLAMRAAHTFLDQNAASNEVAAMPFASDVYFANQAGFNERIDRVDAGSNPVASYFQANGAGIAAVDQSIQRGIVFRYVAQLGEVMLVPGFSLRLSFDYNDLQTARDLMLGR